MDECEEMSYSQFSRIPMMSEKVSEFLSREPKSGFCESWRSRRCGYCDNLFVDIGKCDCGKCYANVKHEDFFTRRRRISPKYWHILGIRLSFQHFLSSKFLNLSCAKILMSCHTLKLPRSFSGISFNDPHTTPSPLLTFNSNCHLIFDVCGCNESPNYLIGPYQNPQNRILS